MSHFMFVQYLLFDVDETLITKGDISFVIADICMQFGYSIDRDVIRRVHHDMVDTTTFPANTDKAFYQEFNARILQALSIPYDQKLIDVLYAEIKKLPYQPFSDTSILEKLSVSIGIVSNWGNSLPDVLRRCFPSVIFSPIVYSDKYNVSKPNPEIFRIALNEISCPRQDIVYIGNSPTLDMEPAKHLGLRTLLLDRDNQYPWYKGEKITSLTEILPYIKN